MKQFLADWRKAAARLPLIFMGIEPCYPLVAITTADFFVQECGKGEIFPCVLLICMMMIPAVSSFA